MFCSSCISLGATSFEVRSQVVICPCNKELSNLNDKFSSRNILNQLLRTVSSIGLLDEANLRRGLGHNREMEGCIVETYTKG